MPFPASKLGLDAYYKTATDLLDDGQFGQAYVLSAFNYAHGQNTGVELKANYTNGNLRLYGNIAWARQRATQIVSNQYLFAPDELAYIANAYVYTDHAQLLTASAGAILSVERHEVLGGHDLSAAACATALPTPRRCPPTPRSMSACRTISTGYRRQNRPRCASTSSTCSIRSTKSGTAPASACSRRNTGRAAASISEFRRSCKHRVFEQASSNLIRGWREEKCATEKGSPDYRAKLQSGRIAPDTPSNAPSTSSATSRRL